MGTDKVKKKCYIRKLVYGKKYDWKGYDEHVDEYYDDYERFKKSLEDIDRDYPEWRIVNIQHISKKGHVPYYIFVLEREIIRYVDLDKQQLNKRR